MASSNIGPLTINLSSDFTYDLQDHIIICGFGRVGQIIAQLLSERLIPFVALDVRSDRVSIGRALDLPVYFGDAGSREVTERACSAALK